MAVRALGLARKLIGLQLPADSKVPDADYVSPKDSSAFGFTDPKNVEFANTLFAELNQKEKSLVEKLDVLLKQLGPQIPWSYFRAHISDKKLVDDVQSIYDSIFVKGDKVPVVQAYDGSIDNDNAIVLGKEHPSLTLDLSRRIDSLEEEINQETIPLMNPFGDFWLYEKDGPEFHQVFAARPHWNEYINKAADDYAFYFQKDDPVLSDDLQLAFNQAISSKLADFIPTEVGIDLVNSIAQGNVSKDLLEYYNTESLAQNEQALLESYTGEDNAGIALRNPFISAESDPAGKHFHGH